MKPKIYIAISMLIFGSIGLFVKNIALTSAQTALFRGAVGCIFLFCAALITKEKFSITQIKKNIALLICSGAAIGLNWIFLFEAYNHTTVSNATLCYYFAPVFVLFLSPFILKEKLNVIKILCIAASVAGMFLIAGADISAGMNSALQKGGISGILLGLCAAAFYASVIIMNKFIKGLPNIQLTMLQLFFAAAVLLPYVLATTGFSLSGAGSNGLVLLLVLGIVHTGIGYLLYFSGIQKVQGQTAALLGYIDPAAAILLSGIFLNEKLGGMQIAGGILILSASFISGIKKEKNGQKNAGRKKLSNKNAVQ